MVLGNHSFERVASDRKHCKPHERKENIKKIRGKVEKILKKKNGKQREGGIEVERGETLVLIAAAAAVMGATA